SRWIDAIEAGDWPRKQQAVGELLFLFATRQGSPASASERVQHALTLFENGSYDSRLILGIAHAAARLWSNPERRTAATRVLKHLIPRAEDAKGVPEAVMSAFREGDLEWDEHTKTMVAALTRAPQIIVLGKSFGLIDSLRSLLPIGAEQIADLLLSVTAHLI